MKKFPAIATIEFVDVATGIFATDAMIKKAPIFALKCGTVSAGRFLTLIGGTTASVEESFAEGCNRAGTDHIVDSLILPDVHPGLLDGILGVRTPPGTGAVAIFEADTISTMLRATEVALKGTAVDLVETRLADDLLAGKGISVIHGDLFDVEAALTLALDDIASRGGVLNHRLLTAPHDALAKAIAGSTRFDPEGLQTLADGETEA